MEMEAFSTADYAWCKTCQEGFDWWKYEDLKEASHEGHDVRNATEEELPALILECDRVGCFQQFEEKPYDHQPLPALRGC